MLYIGCHIAGTPLLSLLEVLVVHLELVLLMLQLGLKLSHIALNLSQVPLQHASSQNGLVSNRVSNASQVVSDLP